MSSYETHEIYLRRFYHGYLRDQDTAGFICRVSQHYSVSVLERLAAAGKRTDRRAAVLALGFLGGYEANATVTHALRDVDRCVRILAADAIENVWLMSGTAPQRQRIAAIRRLISSGQLDEAFAAAGVLCAVAPEYAEAWSERAEAGFHLGRMRLALHACHKAIRWNPYHFRAMVGAGHCYIELQHPSEALHWYRRALDIHPDLECVRHEVGRLQRLLNQA